MWPVQNLWHIFYFVFFPMYKIQQRNRNYAQNLQKTVIFKRVLCRRFVNLFSLRKSIKTENLIRLFHTTAGVQAMFVLLVYRLPFVLLLSQCFCSFVLMTSSSCILLLLK